MYVLATCPNNATPRFFAAYLRNYAGVDTFINDRVSRGEWPPSGVIAVGANDAAILTRMPDSHRVNESA